MLHFYRKKAENFNHYIQQDNWYFVLVTVRLLAFHWVPCIAAHDKDYALELHILVRASHIFWKFLHFGDLDRCLLSN